VAVWQSGRYPLAAAGVQPGFYRAFDPVEAERSPEQLRDEASP
jgi:hypothetical protein